MVTHDAATLRSLRVQSLCNVDVANDLLPVESAEDVRALKSLIQRHLKFTGSDVARRILLSWDRSRVHFKKVFPHEYRRALGEAEALAKAEAAEAALLASSDAKVRTEGVVCWPCVCFLLTCRRGYQLQQHDNTLCSVD